MANPAYETAAYRRAKRALRDNPQACAHCGSWPAFSPDHDPPLSSFPDPRDWNGVFLPSCTPCSYRQGGRLGGAATKARWDAIKGVGRLLPEPSRQW